MYAIDKNSGKIHMGLGQLGGVFLALVMLAMAAGVYMGYTSTSSAELLSDQAYAAATKERAGG